MAESSMVRTINVARTAAETAEHRVDAGSQFEQFLLCVPAGAVRAWSKSFTSNNLHLPDHLGGVSAALKPPPARASFAMKEAPAITEGSSITMGMR